VELLGTLRSRRCGSDRELIRHDRASARLRGLTADGTELDLELRRRGGRRVARDGRALARQLDLLGSLRCVGFSALDLDLVRGEPDGRRRWLDRVVLQLEPIYGDLLARLTRLLRQRRRLWHLPMPSVQRHALMDAVDDQLALVGSRIHRRRRRALLRLVPGIQRWHGRLGGHREGLELHYLPGTDLAASEPEDHWRGALQEQLLRQRPLEARLGSPSVGPQRDEIAMTLTGSSARRYGSAGEQRTIILAMKLAELDLVAEVCGQTPVLLLDDVLAELDPRRQGLLLEAVGGSHQCLVSATHLTAFDPGWRRDSQLVRVDGGRVLPLASVEALADQV
jgi:DNA replication and repair protein RecF